MANVLPSTRKVPIRTPFSDGVQVRAVQWEGGGAEERAPWVAMIWIWIWVWQDMDLFSEEPATFPLGKGGGGGRGHVHVDRLAGCSMQWHVDTLAGCSMRAGRSMLTDYQAVAC